MSTIQERFNQLKHHYNLSGRGLASVLGMSSATVTNYLSGAKAPSYEFLNALLATYPGVSAEWLLRGDGPMLRTQPADLTSRLAECETNLLVKEGVIKELRAIILEKNKDQQSPERRQLVG